MRPIRLASALSIGLLAAAAMAAPGDIVVPAHRSKNGTLIPANVPPSSGGTYMSRQAKGKVLRPASRSGGAARPVPLFTEARPIRQ